MNPRYGPGHVGPRFAGRVNRRHGVPHHVEALGRERGAGASYAEGKVRAHDLGNALGP